MFSEPKYFFIVSCLEDILSKLGSVVSQAALFGPKSCLSTSHLKGFLFSSSLSITVITQLSNIVPFVISNLLSDSNLRPLMLISPIA